MFLRNAYFIYYDCFNSFPTRNIFVTNLKPTDSPYNNKEGLIEINKFTPT